MARNVMFVHGMFLTAKSWSDWTSFFEQRGYHCIAPAWPLHDADPATIRASVPPGLGALSLESVLDAMENAAAPYRDDLIVIGHSVGGLLTQLLAARGYCTLGVPICSVAPNRMLSLDWGFFRNSVSITNPLKGDEPFPMDADGFFANFGNTMPRAESDAAFDKFGIPESRNVLRDCMGDLGKIDMDAPHVPLLFIGADEDEIIPAHLCERNAAAYKDEQSRADYMKFTKRGHYICGQAGWQEVAGYVADWIEQAAPIAVTRAAPLPVV